jgi:phosphoribosylformimino-5-aminoimidazole carboxamide ribotide isomerase
LYHSQTLSFMKIIPVIDLKDGIVVHARHGNREQYQAIDTELCKSSDIFQVIEAFLGIYAFDTLYIADLNAIIHQDNHNHHLITKVLKHFSPITFWVDRGYQKYESNKLHPGNALAVLGSESYQNETIAEIKSYNGNFILSLDYSDTNALGAESLFYDCSFWPQNIIIMTLGRVGSNRGPDIDKLTSFCRQFPNKNFIAAGGIRNKEDCMLLSDAGIHQALVASALHNGAITTEDITKFQAKKYPV